MNVFRINSNDQMESSLSDLACDEHQTAFVSSPPEPQHTRDP